MADLNLKSVIRPKFDFSNVDINAIDADKVDLGTNTQDCALIASFYERSAHSTPSESAVFATLSRTIQNNKKFALEAAKSLDSYLQAPEQGAAKAVQQAKRFAVSVPGTEGVATQTDHGKEAMTVGTQDGSTLNNQDFGSDLLDWARDCIPCSLRIQAFLELHPNVDLLAAMESHIKGALGVISDITSLLNNFDIYGSMCEILDLLSFMCIPDLQRIIAALMALFMLQVPSLDGLMGMLQAIIAPIFAPILMAITALLDQFSLLVTNPLTCVIDSINAQLKKLNVKVPNVQAAKLELDPSKIEELTKGLSGGLQQLSSQLQEAVLGIKDKLDFYVSQVKAMLGELGGGDTAYLQAKVKILQIIRMISFVVAIITAITQGHMACKQDRSPELSEVDNFFNTYLNPNAAFNLSIVEGEILVTEKDPAYLDARNGPTAPLPELGNVLTFEGEDLLPEIHKAATDIVQPIRVSIPCKLELNVDDVSKVNRWMEELS